MLGFFVKHQDLAISRFRNLVKSTFPKLGSLRWPNVEVSRYGNVVILSEKSRC